MAPSLTKMVAGAAAGYAGWKFLDSQYAVGSDLELLSRMVTAGKSINGKPVTFSVPDMWEETVARSPNKAAVVFAEDGKTLTFKELDEFASKVAVWAREKAGYKQGDVIAIFMANRLEYVALLLGLSKAGITAALINNNNKAKPLVHSITVASCKAVIFGSEVGEAIHEVQAEIEGMGCKLYSMDDSGGNYAVPGAVSLDEQLREVATTKAPKSYREGIHRESAFGYIYTSGTTGLPKACLITHYKYQTMSMGGPLFGLSADDRMYTALPLYHSSGLGLGFGNCVNLGCTVIVSRKFSASRFFKECAETRATAVQYIGELCRYLLNSPKSEWDQKHQVRVAIGNGLRKEIWIEFQERFNIPEIGEFYGSTEGTIATGNHSRGVLDGDLASVGSIGRYGALMKKLLGFKIVKHDVASESVIRDPSTGLCIECAPGETGELLGKIDDKDPRAQFKGYTNKEATEKKILRDVLVKGDKYFRTGDLVRQDADYRLFFMDRIGDTFRWKGENVSTGEVSEIVSTFPGVLEANVYGVKVPGQEDGRACMCAMVVENPETFDLDGLSAHVHKNLANYALPLFLRYLPEMEITGTFKHRKVEFVKDGLDISVVTDKMFYLDTADKKYKVLDGPALNAIATQRAKL